jgi:hypothetical protein
LPRTRSSAISTTGSDRSAADGCGDPWTP